MARSIITGIDVGTHHVKVIIVDVRQRNEKGLPKIIGTGFAETRGLRHGYITNIRDASESISRAVRAAEEKAQVKIKKAFVGVGGIGLASVTVSSILMTSRADAEITDLDIKKLHEQNEKDIPHAAITNRRIIYDIPLQYKIDGYPSYGNPEGLKGNKLELKTLFITCLDHHVSQLIQAVNGAGIEVEDMMASPVVAGFSTLTKTQKIAGCVLANIGAETVSVSVFENNIPSSLEVFEIGSTDITNDIALGLKVPLEEAEQIKVGAITGTSYPRKKLEEIIAARLSDMFELVEGHLRKIGRHGLLPAGIVLTGGGSGIPSIEELAKANLKLPARVGTLALSDKPTIKDNIWSVAYGLCLWGIHAEEGPEIDTTKQFFDNFKKVSLKWLKKFLP